MPVVASGSEIIVNTGHLGANQFNVQTAQLASGGWVTAWQTNVGGQSDVMFQRFDGAGNKVGAAVIANLVAAGNQILHDIVATSDDRFTLAWSTTNIVTTRSFDGSNGAATSNEVSIVKPLVPFTTVNGAQLVATAAGEYKVIYSTTNGINANFGHAGFTTAGETVSADVNLTSTQPVGTFVTDATEGGGAGNQFAVLNNGVVLSTADTFSASAGLDAGGIIKLQEGTFVVAADLFSFSPPNSKGVGLTALTGTGIQANTYVISSEQALAFTVGVTSDGSSATTTVGPIAGLSPNTFDKLLLNLGDGRILTIGVIDPGTNLFTDGIYANVYNTSTGGVESNSPLQIDPIQNPNINTSNVNISVSAALLLDGRVAVSWSNFNNLTDFDVFTRIIDPRVVGVNLAGTSEANSFVGSSFIDTFVDIADNDSVDGAGGVDTVVLAATTARRQIDLADPNRFESAPFLLTNIENLTGSNLDDEFHGSSADNALSGGLGNDLLFGRNGNDVLDGGDGADLMEGGLGNDTMNGGLGDDVMRGGAGSDSANGGAGLDRIDGGADDDVLAGGADADVMFGRAGNDQLDGGAGNDFATGGDGEDLLFGRDGDDSLAGGEGDDTISGGTGNDRIEGGSGTNAIDGGVGTDTLIYGKGSSITTLSGFYVDLDLQSGPVGDTGGIEAEDDIITGIENISGSEANDYLGGDTGTNVLRGRGGNDSLLGRAGADTLFGGAGNDLFIFDRTNGGNDAVRDFLVGADKIALSSGVFGDISEANFASRFVKNAGGAPAANGNAQLILQTSGVTAGRLAFDADGNGAGAAVTIATLSFLTATGLADISAADFTFI
ncbi:MAG: calcium-binding protein [Cyanobium sp.]